jgi:hypothetical protein
MERYRAGRRDRAHLIRMRLHSIDIEVLEHSRNTETHLEGQRTAERCYLGPGLMGLKSLGKCAVHCGGIWLRQFLFRCIFRPMGSPWVVVHDSESQTARKRVQDETSVCVDFRPTSEPIPRWFVGVMRPARRAREVYKLRSVLLLVDPLARPHLATLVT